MPKRLRERQLTNNNQGTLQGRSQEPPVTCSKGGEATTVGLKEEGVQVRKGAGLQPQRTSKGRRRWLKKKVRGGGGGARGGQVE